MEQTNEFLKIGKGEFRESRAVETYTPRNTFTAVSHVSLFLCRDPSLASAQKRRQGNAVFVLLQYETSRKK